MAIFSAVAIVVLFWIVGVGSRYGSLRRRESVVGCLQKEEADWEGEKMILEVGLLKENTGKRQKASRKPFGFTVGHQDTKYQRQLESHGVGQRF